MKVVDAKEMKKIESLALKEGFLEEEFMLKAGLHIANLVMHYAKKYHLEKKVILLIGKGNNGGDGYVAGSHLLENGFNVTAFHLCSLENSSPLNQFFCQKFQKQNAQVTFLKDKKDFQLPEKGILLDGILGTGFRGTLDPFFCEIISLANASRLFRLSIDIPSGLDGSTGKVCSTAIKADVTAYLGLPKTGFFFQQGYNYTGHLEHVDFGLKEKYINQAEETAILYDSKSLHFPEIVRTRHKYQAGYVLTVAGSPQMRGAAKLCTMASLRAGAGIVRLFHHGDNGYNLDPEVICCPYEEKVFQEEVQRATAICIGPGIGRNVKSDFLSFLLGFKDISFVLDADALFFLSENENVSLPKNCIITPHEKEMLRLLKKDYSENLLEESQKYAEKKGCTIVLKGAPTLLLQPGKKAVIINKGDPGMATAGSGDVLTGIIAGLLAQKMSCYDAALLGVYLHGSAGEIAAKEKTSFCMVASDILDSLPKAFKACLHAAHRFH